MADNVGSTSIWNLKGEAEEYAEISYPYAIAENASIEYWARWEAKAFSNQSIGALRK
jgi:hypothetical protein